MTEYTWENVEEARKAYHLGAIDALEALLKKFSKRDKLHPSASEGVKSVIKAEIKWFKENIDN